MEDNVGKSRLAKAFFDLLDTMPYEKISVSAICTKAGVSRQTFYRHFENKDDVAKWHFYEEACKDMYQVGRGMSWHESIESVCRNWQTFAKYIQVLFKGENYESVKMYAYRSRVSSLEETVKLITGNGPSPLIAFQIRFFASAEVENLAHFGFEQTLAPSVHARYIESCVPKELHDLLEPKSE